ncbi:MULTISPECIES: serine/threonine-protein kinase [Streptomyces]|uniref:serine/threonine-protein kinase n=1 Tax=Streptomyces TaxID=1883 RepID=UPI00287FD07D|nr:serine/threonine-protein kinase [Streptomyces sp. CGMCC 4.1456]WNF67562.1 serine/threonine-protein kinase [Streptomyces sp. CGMCC 4.1456]
MSTGEYGQTEGAGRLLAGRYRVAVQLGRGGMGIVWKAVDEVLGREVAVKELRTYTDVAGPELAALRLRMQREARAAARVRHPGVIAVHDIAEVDGRPLIVMELVDGPSLDDVLRESGTLDPREAAGIGAKVMDALSAAHRAGVLHRDVKPGNILLDRSGRVVLTDFGIATMDDPGDGSATHLTRSGELVGSLDYLAPERAQGADPGPASDIWALGATLYAAVEGASPFRRTSTFSTLTAIVTEPLPEPLRAGALAPVLQRLMEKRPEARPEAGQARELLQSVADTGGTDTPTSPLRGPVVPSSPPRPETERSVPAVPPGFGPPQQPDTAGPHEAPDTPGSGTPAAFGAAGISGAAGSGSGPYGPGTSPHGFGPSDPDSTGPGASAPTGPVNSGRPPRRKSRGLLAAAALTVVLAAAGATAAVLSNSDDKETGARTDAARADAGSSSAPGRTDDGSNAPRPTQQGDEKGKAPSKKPGDEKAPEPATSAPSKSSGTTGGTPDGTSDGSDTGGGSGNAGTGDAPTTPAPEPACHAIGGGKYNCQVWKTADSYTASGTKVGVLNAGTNYFYCQQNLGRRETDGRWTNVWWAKTDDDSGNTNVWVSDVYVKGGDNDAPVPGLPVC